MEHTKQIGACRMAPWTCKHTTPCSHFGGFWILFFLLDAPPYRSTGRLYGPIISLRILLVLCPAVPHTTVETKPYHTLSIDGNC
jgi:hypothetical protein